MATESNSDLIPGSIESLDAKNRIILSICAAFERDKASLMQEKAILQQQLCESESDIRALQNKCEISESHLSAFAALREKSDLICAENAELRLNVSNLTANLQTATETIQHLLSEKQQSDTKIQSLTIAKSKLSKQLSTQKAECDDLIKREGELQSMLQLAGWVVPRQIMEFDTVEGGQKIGVLQTGVCESELKLRSYEKENERLREENHQLSSQLRAKERKTISQQSVPSAVETKESMKKGNNSPAKCEDLKGRTQRHISESKAALAMKVSELEKMLREANQNLENSQYSLNKMSQISDDLQQEISSKENLIKTLQTREGSFKANLAEKSDRIRSLLSEVAEFDKCKHDLITLRDYHDFSEHEKSQWHTERILMQTQLTDLSTNVDRLALAITESKTKCEELEQTRESNLRTITALGAQIEKTKRESLQKEQQFASELESIRSTLTHEQVVNRDFTSQIAHLQGEISDLRFQTQQYREKSVLADAHSSALADCQQQIASVVAERDAWITQCSDLEAAYTELQEIARKPDQWKREAQVNAKRIAEMRGREEKQQAEMQRLKHLIREKETEIANVSMEARKAKCSDYECVICENEAKNTVFLPCRHLCIGEKCSQLIEKCPICRESVRETIIIYV